MRAAAAVGPATRPLPLFYAIEQGGRALLAAFEDDAEWPNRNARESNRHGLTDKPDPGYDAWFSRRWLTFKEKGLFPRVLALFDGYTPPTEAIQIGAAWSALPDLIKTRIPEREWPRAVPVTLSRVGPDDDGMGLTIQLDGVEGHFPSAPSPESVQARLQDLLRAHPDLAGWQIERVGLGTWSIETHKLLNVDATIGWTFDDGTYDDLSAMTLALEHRRHDARWLIPALNSANEQLPAFMIWWALLYGLSIQARYHPARWYEALAINVSLYAVPIEDLLNEALGAVPQLLLERIAAKPFLL